MKFDMYCDWSPVAIGVVVVEEGRGVYYNRFNTQWNNDNNSCQGELQAVNICLDIIEELGLNNVTIHTDHEPLVQSIQRGTFPQCKRTRRKASRATKVEMYRSTIERITSNTEVSIVHCKSHAANPFNCAADVLARKESNSTEHGDWEVRLGCNPKFIKAAKSITKPNPTLWDVVQAWFVNLTYGAVAC